MLQETFQQVWDPQYIYIENPQLVSNCMYFSCWSVAL
jgi:hypothetical protein